MSDRALARSCPAAGSSGGDEQPAYNDMSETHTAERSPSTGRRRSLKRTTSVKCTTF